jgi:2-hydroxy-3-oxopropionate reductase
MVSSSHAFPPSVGIVGLGNMGLPMARHLLDAARPVDASVTIHGRSRDKLTVLLDEGARWAERPCDLAGVSVLLSMLPDLPQLDEVLWGVDGLVRAVTTPTLVLVGSSSSPEGVRERAARAAEETGGLLRFIDCPVSGGVEGAAAGSLAIMVGGDLEDVARARPVLDALGTPVHLGPLGSGEVAKACNQMVVGATVLALSEAAVLADRSGLDVSALFALLSGGYAGSRVLETRGPQIAARDYRVAGAAKYMTKDLGIALSEAERTGTALPQTGTDHAAFTALVELGLGDDDLSVARRYIESLS